MSEKKIVVGLGEILWDMFPQGKELGGAPSNFAYHAMQLGMNGVAVSAIGGDCLGQAICSVLDERRLTYLLEEVDYPTGTVQVTVDKQGVPQYEICEQVAWDYIPFSPRMAELAAQTDVVCFGSLAQRNQASRTTILAFLEAMPADSLKVFDVNLRQHYYTQEVIEQSLIRSDVFKINEDEIVTVARMFALHDMDEEQQCRKLLERFDLQVIILTKGDQGSYVFTATETSFLPTPQVEVVDTVGAGDAFTAAFVVAWVQGKPLRQAHEQAVKVAACVCMTQGAMPEKINYIL